VKKVPITASGAEKMKDELRRLKTVDRPRIIQAIAEARSHGDLSENAEYHAAKEQQGFIEGRIAELETKISSAQIIDPATVRADGRVVFGATLDLMDEHKSPLGGSGEMEGPSGPSFCSWCHERPPAAAYWPYCSEVCADKARTIGDDGPELAQGDEELEVSDD